MDQRWDEAVAAIGSQTSSATGSTRRMQTAGARDQVAATGSTRTMQTTGYQGGSMTNATGSPNHMQTAGPQGGSGMGCWPSRTTADIVAVHSPFVKNDGSASEHVRAELAFYRRTLTSLVRMDTEYQFGPLNYKDDEAEKEHLVTQGTCVLKAELWYADHELEKCRADGRGRWLATRFSQTPWWSSAPHTPKSIGRQMPWFRTGWWRVASLR